MDVPGTPRSLAEIRFFVEETPCPKCGALGVDRTYVREDAGGTLYDATCPVCGTARQLRFGKIRSRATGPAFHLGEGTAPSELIGADRFAAIAARELAKVPDDPTAFATVAEYEAARRSLVHARTALVELAKFGRTSPDLARTETLWERYKAAKPAIEAKPGAQPAARTITERARQHRAWLARGRTGDGRLVMRGETWRGTPMGNAEMTAAIIERSTFDACDLSYGTFVEAELREARLLGCRLSSGELARARFERCDLTGSSLQLSKLPDVVVDGGDWQRIDAIRSLWQRARLTGVDLRGAQLGDTVLDGAVLERCDLRGADLRHDPQLARLGTATNARFVDCDFRDARLDGWRAEGAVFERCRFEGATGWRP